MNCICFYLFKVKSTKIGFVRVKKQNVFIFCVKKKKQYCICNRETEEVLKLPVLKLTLPEFS